MIFQEQCFVSFTFYTDNAEFSGRVAPPPHIFSAFCLQICYFSRQNFCFEVGIFILRSPHLYYLALALYANQLFIKIISVCYILHYCSGQMVLRGGYRTDISISSYYYFQYLFLMYMYNNLGSNQSYNRLIYFGILPNVYSHICRFLYDDRYKFYNIAICVYIYIIIIICLYNLLRIYLQKTILERMISFLEYHFICENLKFCNCIILRELCIYQQTRFRPFELK